MNTLKLPSGWDNQKNKGDESWLNTRLVSSLSQQTQWKHSPAFGHQARNSSAASLWPRRDDALSREAILAEKLSLNRRLKYRGDRDAKDGVYTKRRHQSEPTGEEHNRHRFFPSRYLRRLRTSYPVRTSDSAPSHQCLPRISSLASKSLSSGGSAKQKNALKVMRGLRQRNMSDDGQPWSLEAFVRSESHPVFVQPVKGYVMKRWGVFRSRSHIRSSVLASSRSIRIRPRISSDSIRLDRRTQVMTTIQDSGDWLGELSPNTVPALNAPAGGENPLDVETSEDPTINAPLTVKPEPLISTEGSGENLSMENTNHVSSPDWVPYHCLQSLESDQTRNRTSTSGTTVYSPPVIAEASPNAKKLESDGSTSGTSSGIRYSNSPHE